MEIFSKLFFEITIAIVLFILGFFVRTIYIKYYYKHPLFKLWGFHNNTEEVSIITGNIPHYKYQHVLASGDMLAFSEVISVLRNNYKKELINTFFSKEFHSNQIKKYNIISIGGPRWNWVTREILHELKNPFEFNIKEKLLFDRRKTPYGKYKIIIDNKDVKTDYGIIIKTKNPYNKKKFVIIFGGFTTYGVLGATKCYSYFREFIPKEIRKQFYNSQYYSVIVKVNVIRDEIGETDVNPEILKDTFNKIEMGK